MKIQQHDGVVVDAVVTCSRASPSVYARGRGVTGEREAPGVKGAAAPPSPPLYRPPWGGAGPGDPISQGAAAKGGGVPPKASGPPHPRVPTLGAMGGPRGRTSPLRAGPP